MQRLVFTSLPNADIVVFWPDFWVGLKVSAQKISLMIRGSITIAFFVGTRIPQFQKHPNQGNPPFLDGKIHFFWRSKPQFLMVTFPSATSAEAGSCNPCSSLEEPPGTQVLDSSWVLPHESVEKLDVGSRGDQRFSQKRVQMEFFRDGRPWGWMMLQLGSLIFG